MADTRENIILQVGLDGGKVASDLADISRQIANVKKNQQDLNEQYKNGEISLAKYTEQTQSLKDEQSWLQKEQKGLIATQKLLTQTTDTYGDSLNAERQKLADMQKAYDQLDAEMRKGEGGQAFLEAIKQQTDVVKGLEEETGRFQRNVGNYQSAFDGAAEKAKLLNEAFKQTSAGSTALGKGIDTIDKTAKVFSRNPFFAIIGLVAPIFAKITEAIRKNEKVMKAFHMILSPIGKAIEWLANIIATVLVAAINALKAAWEGISSFFGAIVSFFTGSSNAADENAEAMKKAAEEAEEYKKQVQALTKELEKEKKALTELAKQHKYETDLMKAQGKAEQDVRIQSWKNAKEELEERKRMYEESKKAADEYWSKLYDKYKFESDKIKDLGNGMVSIAMTEEEGETLDKIRAQRDEFYTEMMDAERAFNLQTVETGKWVLDQRKKRADDEKKQLIEQLEEERQIRQTFADLQLSDLERQAQDALDKSKELIDAGREALNAYQEEEEEEAYIPTPEEMARNMFGLDDEGVEYFMKLLDEGVSFAEAKTKALTDQTGRNVEKFAKSFGELGSSFEEMGDALEYMSEENEAAKKAQKAFAFSGIVLNQAQSISEGALAVASGIRSVMQSPLPVLAKIPMVISIAAQLGTMIAGVMSSISQAKQIFAKSDAGNFANGGTIDGTSYTGDRLIAHVNSGEGIYTGKQANNLLQEIANNPLRGGADMDAMTAAFTAAVAALPAPKMVYSEFNDFTQEVATYNELAAV